MGFPVNDSSSRLVSLVGLISMPLILSCHSCVRACGREREKITVERVLIAWFNDCVLPWSSQIANLIIALIDPVPYYRIRASLCLRI